MKNYYQILGVPEDAIPSEIRSAFRKLAFACHPDTNPDTPGAEDRFKEINEAYGVLSDPARRQQYDFARKTPFASHSGPGFSYSQQDIFRDIFSNQAAFSDLSQMFSRAGLRFDQDFLNRVFFSGNGIMFQFFTSPGAGSGRSAGQAVAARRPGLFTRLLTRMALGLGKFVIDRATGASTGPQSLDYHADLEVSPDEAASGGEKPVVYQRNGERKELLVKVPAGVRSGTRIRLRKMGLVSGQRCGDLYLHVKVRE